MNSMRIVAILLIAAGTLGLAYGSFSYISGSHGAKLGPIVLSIKEKKTYFIPVWAGIAAIVAGCAILLLG